MSQPPSQHDPGAEGPRDDDATTAPDGPAGDDALWDTAPGSEAPGEPDDVPTQQVPVTPPTRSGSPASRAPHAGAGRVGPAGPAGPAPRRPLRLRLRRRRGRAASSGATRPPPAPLGTAHRASPASPATATPATPSPANGKATAALVVGISTMLMSWCCGAGVLGVVAIVLGVRARSEIQASGGRQTGDGLAIAGIVTGAIAVVIGLAALALIVFGIVDSFNTTSSSGGVPPVEG